MTSEMTYETAQLTVELDRWTLTLLPDGPAASESLSEHSHPDTDESSAKQWATEMITKLTVDTGRTFGRWECVPAGQTRLDRQQFTIKLHSWTDTDRSRSAAREGNYRRERSLWNLRAALMASPIVVGLAGGLVVAATGDSAAARWAAWALTSVAILSGFAAFGWLTVSWRATQSLPRHRIAPVSTVAGLIMAVVVVKIAAGTVLSWGLLGAVAGFYAVAWWKVRQLDATVEASYQRLETTHN